MSRSENGSVSSNGGNNPSTTNQQRLCHIVKRDDFDGYGFNLHSEKGKPGQYIGKVDENSPAEQAGLRQGDRIIEVNGVNIGSETHKQVVQRIKAITNEVRLLVIDPNQEKKSVNNSKIINDSTVTSQITTSTITVQSSTVQGETNQKIINKDVSSGKIDDNKDTTTTTTNINISGTPSPTVSTKSETNSASCSNNNNNININKTTTTTTTSDKTDSINSNNKSDVEMNIPSSIPSHQNGTTATGAGTTTAATINATTTTTTNNTTTSSSSSNLQKSTGLNLPMTAAEMRAKLLARKKYDPKNDSVDLRKKFEIIQKL